VEYIFRADGTIKVDAFTMSYIETALWSTPVLTEDGSGDAGTLDDHFGPEDIPLAILQEMIRDCEDFQRSERHALHFSGLSPEQAGANFWLTRERHGAGFWDHGQERIWKHLTDAAHAYGSPGDVLMCAMPPVEKEED